jgi:hypothetical protein
MLSRAIFFICLFSISSIYASDYFYGLPTLSLSSKNLTIFFCHKSLGEREGMMEQDYRGAFLCSTLPKIGDTPLKKHDATNLFYYCTDAEERFKRIFDQLEPLKEENIGPSSLETSEEPLTISPYSCRIEVNEVAQKMKEASNVVITFGAGLSAGYVPTLVDFFDSLGIEKVPSEDAGTDESMIRFAEKLISNPSLLLQTVQTEWEKVVACSLNSTPAHLALKNIVDSLKRTNKNVFVYTDNLDGIHKRVGIPLTEKAVSPQETNIIYPDLEVLRSGPTFVLVCGQSFDFHGILGTIKTRAGMPPSHEVTFVSLNPCPTPIKILQNFDPNFLEYGETFDPTSLRREVLEMLWLEGSGHDLLPCLERVMTS